jgi:hypothetical protein
MGTKMMAASGLTAPPIRPATAGAAHQYHWLTARLGVLGWRRCRPSAPPESGSLGPGRQRDEGRAGSLRAGRATLRLRAEVTRCPRLAELVSEIEGPTGVEPSIRQCLPTPRFDHRHQSVSARTGISARYSMP